RRKQKRDRHEKQRAAEQNDAEPPRIERRQSGDADHHREGRQKKQKLPHRKMKTVVNAETRGGGGPRREKQHHPDRGDEADEKKQHVIDRPPPAGERGSVEARRAPHAAAPAASCAWPTRRRNRSP